ncbi:MAG: RtcB family protein [DPANN group archaeon]|nr:RtcB family protein [DPANN group archaeon]
MKQISEGIFEFPAEGGMEVPARVYMTKKMLEEADETAIQQARNVAHLPGILKHSIILPDGHFGYGFPIGGVAAFDAKTGIVSPGGIGFDINCGVRTLRTSLTHSDIKDKLDELIRTLFKNVPSGVGSEGRIKLNDDELKEVSHRGVDWAIENGYGEKKDPETIEENGKIAGADFSKISSRARARGRPQLGTLGSGNHFLEVQRVESIYDEETAKKFGITDLDQVMVMIHCGSRGFGHQICTDYLEVFNNAFSKWKTDLPDRQLIYAPLESQEAQDYLGAMNCAINFAFTNRQLITHWVRESFQTVFGKDQDALGMDIVYDVCHNIAKFEDHKIDGETRRVCVHRKGATRAFPAGRPEIPEKYRDVGQPVLIPGDMGRFSYVLVGTQKALDETWGSSAHGAGRAHSRSHMLKTLRGSDVKQILEAKGEVIYAKSPKVLAEEAPEAYKNVDDVIEATELAGISKKVIRLKPLGVAKG